MAWFRRRHEEADPIRPDETTAAAPAPVPARPEPAAWRSAPPMPLLVQREVRTSVPTQFAAGLTSWQSPAKLGPLGHLVSADSPAGVLTDLPTSLPAPVTREPEPEAEHAPLVARTASGRQPDVVVQRFAPAPDTGRLPALFTPAPKPVAPASPDMPLAAPVADDQTTPGTGDTPDRDDSPDIPTVAVAAPTETPTASVPPPRPIVPVVAPDVVQRDALEVRAPAPLAPDLDAVDRGARSTGAPESGAAPLDQVVPTLEADHLAPDDPEVGPTATDDTARAVAPEPAPFASAMPTTPALGPSSEPPTTQAPTPPVVSEPTAPAGSVVQRHVATEAPPSTVSTPNIPASPGEPDRPGPGELAASAADPVPGLGLPVSRLADGEPVAPLVGATALVPPPAVPPPPPPAPAAAAPTAPWPGPGSTGASSSAATSGPGATNPSGLGRPVARIADPLIAPAVAAFTRPDPSAPSADHEVPPALAAPGPVGPVAARYAPPEPVPIARLAVTAGDPAATTTTPSASGIDPGAEPMIAPLLGDRAPLPIFTPPDDPRADTGAGDDEAGPDLPAAAPPAVPVSFPATASLPAVLTSADLARPAASAGGPSGPAVQRLPAAGPVPAAASAAVTPRPAPAPVQRVAAMPVSSAMASGPAPTSGPVTSPPVGDGPSAGDVAVASGLGSWAPDGSVVFAPPGADAAADGSAFVQRSVADAGEGTSNGAMPSLQLLPGGAGAPAGGAGAPGSSDAELDELARRLYGRIRVHLRRELVLDRERAGSLIEVPR